MTAPMGDERRWAAAAAGGWALLGLANVVGVSLILDWPTAGLSVRAAHHAVDLGRHVGLGLISALAVISAPRVGLRRSAAKLGALGLASIGVGFVLLPDDLSGVAERNQELLGLSADLTLGLVVCAVGASVPAVAFAVSRLGRWWAKIALLVFVAAGYHLNATISPGGNAGPHLYLSWLLAIGLAALLEGTPIVGWVAARSRGVAGVAAIGAGWGLFGALAPVTASVRAEQSEWQANVLPDWDLRSALARSGAPRMQAVGRGARRAIPLTKHELLPKDGVVLLLSVDGLRARSFTKENRKYFPHLWDLAQRGTWMTRAQTAGALTVYSLGSYSTGKYFSQLHWTRKKGERAYWPWTDESEHLAGLLSKAGVFTGHAMTASWMGDAFGMMKGFDRTVYAKNKRRWKWVRGEHAADELIEMLAEHRTGRRFLFTHFLDSHHPYWPGVRKGRGEKERYLHALRYVDGHVGRILRALEQQGLQGRAVVIVTADHGESLGEHNSHGHAVNLFQEVMNVPIIFAGPGIPARRVDDLVSTIDLAPTILDLFGVPIPPAFMGRTAVPLLLGQHVDDDRFVGAECIDKRALVFSDGKKVIYNRKNGVVRIYDLISDPGERNNLSDAMTPELQERVDTLERFFADNQFTAPGYVVPFRK